MRNICGCGGAERREAKLVIKDSRSRPRIRLLVDETDQPRIEMLNAAGDMVHAIAPALRVFRQFEIQADDPG